MRHIAVPNSSIMTKQYEVRWKLLEIIKFLLLAATYPYTSAALRMKPNKMD